MRFRFDIRRPACYNTDSFLQEEARAFMTKKLYDDPWRFETVSAVTACVPVRDGFAASTGATVFFPGGGGQTFDTGTLGGLPVSRVYEADGDVWHVVPAPVAPGTEVLLRIDAAARRAAAETHTGEHVLSGLALALFGARNVGFHMGRDFATADFDAVLSDEQLAGLERAVNDALRADAPVAVSYPGEEELAALPLRKRPTVDSHIRVVAMGDYEMVPCGGTHPSSTGQIGPVKILSCAPARGKLRLCFVAGMRAVAYFQQTADCAERLAAALSAGIGDAPEALLREREADLAWQKDASQRLTLAALEVLRTRGTGCVYAGHLPFADRDILLSAARELTREPKAVALLSCPGKNGRALLFARGGEARADMAALLRDCGGRGGGKPDLAQGSAPDGAALEKAGDLLAKMFPAGA